MNLSDEQLEELYKQAFPLAARAVSALGGDLDTARDLFHDALIIYLEKLRAEKLDIKTSSSSYLVGITRMLWFHHFKQQKQQLSFDEELHDMEVIEDFYAEQIESRSLLQRMQQAGTKCLQLLKAFYYDQNTMQEIAGKFNYSSTRSATVQKYKCIEKLREQAKKMMSYEKAA